MSIHFERRRYQKFGYWEKGGERSSNFMKREVSICKKEIRTIGSRGLWTVDLARKTHKFRVWKMGDKLSFDLTNHKVLIREGESRTIGSPRL
jgi:hypothetical protein